MKLGSHLSGEEHGARALVPPAFHFRFRFSLPFLVAALPFGITPARCSVTIDDRDLSARFGPWSFRTPLDNIADAAVTGPYRWPKVLGPPRLSLADGGVTLASNPGPGVCIHFRESVPVLLAGGLLRHPSVTVTVDDPQKLAELLEVAAATGPEPVDQLADDVHVSLMSLTTAQLRERARDLGMTGVSKMKKADLVAALAPGDAGGPGGGLRDGDDG